MAVKWLVLILVLAAVVWRVDVHLLSSLWTVRTFLAMVLVAALVVVSLVANARRHALLVSNPPIPTKVAFESIILSSGLNLFVPGRLAELVKATYLNAALGVPLSHGSSAVVVGRLFDLTAVCMIGVSGLLFTGLTFHALALLAPACCLVALLAVPRIATVLAPHLGDKSGRFLSFLRSVLDHASRSLARGNVTGLVLHTAVVWLTLVAATVLFLQLQPYGRVSLGTSLTVFVATTLSVAIPGLPAGVGAFQAAVIAVLVPEGFSFDQALVLGIALQAAQLSVSACLMPYLLLRSDLGLLSLTRRLFGLIPIQTSHRHD